MSTGLSLNWQWRGGSEQADGAGAVVLGPGSLNLTRGVWIRHCDGIMKAGAYAAMVSMRVQIFR